MFTQDTYYIFDLQYAGFVGVLVGFLVAMYQVEPEAHFYALPISHAMYLEGRLLALAFTSGGQHAHPYSDISLRGSAGLWKALTERQSRH